MMPETKAPQWWYAIFQKGHHDMSIYQIEWAWSAYCDHQMEQHEAIVPYEHRAKQWEQVARNACENEQAIRRTLSKMGIKP
jgi:hypothetical protein